MERLPPLSHPVFGHRITCWIFDRTFAAVKDRSDINSDEFDRFAESRLAQIGRRGLKSGENITQVTKASVFLVVGPCDLAEDLRQRKS
jgi:hypothetical protein